MPPLIEAHYYISQKISQSNNLLKNFKLFFIFTLKYITPLSNQLNKKEN